MPTLTGTPGNDVLVATTAAGFHQGDTVDALAGNDIVTLSPGVTYITGPGEDTVSGGAFAYWPVHTHVSVNLAEGWAEDGFGFIDHVSAISELHLPAAGADVTGSNAAETVFWFGGSGTLAMGGGQDVVKMWQLDSSNYTIRQAGNTVVITSGPDRVELRDVERVEFADRSIDTTYHDPFFALQYNIRSFTESQWSEPWTYAGVTYPAQLVSYFPQAVSPFDVGADGDPDLVVPLNRGYRTGVDTRYHFQVLENVGGKLAFSESMTDDAPFIAGARRVDTIFINRYGQEALVTVAHDTAIETETRTDIPWRFGDISISLARPFHDIASELVAPGTLPRALETGRATATNAHSMAVGDFNGDGMDDILVGEFSGSFVLLQTASGYFTYLTNDFLHTLSANWREPTIANSQPALLLDLHMADLNGDGLDDIVAGWGGDNVAARSRVFFNDGHGNFSATRSNLLPVSVYGVSNTLHMKTFSADFDKDGDLDLVVLNARSDPYYGGNYLQFLENDGHGNFTDATNARLADPAALPDTYSDRLHWTDFWQVLDVNGDGALDIVGHRVSGPVDRPVFWLNDGSGHFALSQPPLDGARPISWGDFDGDGRIEAVTWSTVWTDPQGSSSINTFSDYELKTTNPSLSRAFDINGNAGFVAKTLGAVFGRAAIDNPSLTGIGLRFADSGLSHDALTDLALNAALPQRTNESVVRLLYANVVGTQPDAPTVSEFVSMITSGQYTQVSLAQMAADHELNASNIDLVGLARDGLAYLPAQA